jgi:hypothetical protein
MKARDKLDFMLEIVLGMLAGIVIASGLGLGAIMIINAITKLAEWIAT